ncbi:MAG: MBL fold metallo-hydrolase [Geminicoccaceae bacterium]
MGPSAKAELRKNGKTTDVFDIRFWGVRGTVPCTSASTMRYGGNTACVEMRCGDERLIFDAGTGLRQLGREMMSNGCPIRSHLFFTHTHMDHVIGLPFFKPAYDQRNKFDFWCGHLSAQGRKLGEVLHQLMQPPFFPVPLDIMHACIGFHDFVPGETIEVGERVRVRTASLNHPGGSTAYRVDFAGRSACYVTDTEHVPGNPDGAILDLISGADLVIYDATYTDDEFAKFRGWGHSTWQEGMRLCEAAGARRLVAFHHDPEHDDEVLDRIAADMSCRRAGSLVAREGLVIEL